MNRKFQLKNSPALAAASLLVGVALAIGGTVLATSIGTDLSVSGISTLTGAVTVTGAVTANGSATLGDAAADTLTINATTTVVNNGGVDGSFYIGNAAADILTISATTTFVNNAGVLGSFFVGDNSADLLTVMGATTHVGTTAVGADGTALTQILTGYTSCGKLGDTNTSIAATSTGVIACQGNLSNVSANDAVFLTATTSGSGLPRTPFAGVFYAGKASTSAANVIQAEVYNGTGAAWTITTSTWRYLIIR